MSILLIVLVIATFGPLLALGSLALALYLKPTEATSPWLDLPLHARDALAKALEAWKSVWKAPVEPGDTGRQGTANAQVAFDETICRLTGRELAKEVSVELSAALRSYFTKHRSNRDRLSQLSAGVLASLNEQLRSKVLAGLPNYCFSLLIVWTVVTDAKIRAEVQLSDRSGEFYTFPKLSPVDASRLIVEQKPPVDDIRIVFPGIPGGN